MKAIIKFIIKIRVNGKMIKDVEKEFITIQMALRLKYYLYYDYLKDLNISFLQSNLKFGRVHENVCILWTPRGETVKGRTMEEILALKNNFELDNDHNLIIYT